jgi:opacity protein-like surface antigen
MSLPARRLSVALAAVLVLCATPGMAQDWENDVRIRAGVYVPEDLPTPSGPIYGLEVRNLLWERDGFVYSVSVYDESESATEQQGANAIHFAADIKLIPVLLGWFHLFPQERFNVAFGAGIGLYESEAFSGGVTSTSQVADAGDFRFLQDDTYFGFHVFVGADFFPQSRWGVGVEGRLHLVENDFNASELSVGGILRF